MENCFCEEKNILIIFISSHWRHCWRYLNPHSFIACIYSVFSYHTSKAWILLSWNSKISISSPSTRSKNCQRLKMNKSYDSLVSIYRIWEITWGNWTLKLVHCEFDQVNPSFTLQLFSGEAYLEITNNSCRNFFSITLQIF